MEAKANGKAKIVCENFTNSPQLWMVRSMERRKAWDLAAGHAALSIAVCSAAYVFGAASRVSPSPQPSPPAAGGEGVLRIAKQIRRWSASPQSSYVFSLSRPAGSAQC